LTVLDIDGTPQAGLRVYAFKGATYILSVFDEVYVQPENLRAP
jgi:hypothetical protein